MNGIFPKKFKITAMIEIKNNALLTFFYVEGLQGELMRLHEYLKNQCIKGFSINGIFTINSESPNHHMGIFCPPENYEELILTLEKYKTDHS